MYIGSRIVRDFITWHKAVDNSVDEALSVMEKIVVTMHKDGSIFLDEGRGIQLASTRTLVNLLLKLFLPNCIPW